MRKNATSCKTGSALLLTLLMVSLMTAIVLSFTVFVRMELRRTQNRMDHHHARQNAKLALHLALNKLQMAAGPDQRVTARADAFGSSFLDENKWISGVWDVTDASGTPSWLVTTRSATGTYDPFGSFDPAQPLPSDAVTILGEGTLGGGTPSDQFVRIPTATLAGDDSIRIAYWISDEGVKASLALTNPLDDLSSLGILSEKELEGLDIASPARTALEFAFSEDLETFAATIAEDPESEPLRRSFQKISFLEDFSFLPSFADPSEHNGTDGSGNIHDYTTNAVGLLTNTLDGGIKSDLSMEPGLLGAGFEAFMDYPAYIQEPRVTNDLVTSKDDFRRLHFLTPPTTFTPAPGEIVHGVAPLITDFGLQFAPRFSSGEVQLAMRFVLELWNPYSSGLVDEELTLEISGFEPVTVRLHDTTDSDGDSDTDEVIWENQINVLDTLGDGQKITITLNKNQHHTNPDPSIPSNALDSLNHSPGRLLYWIGPDLRKAGQTDASFGTRASSGMTLYMPVQPALGYAGTDSSMNVSYQIDETLLEVRLRRENGDIVARYTDFVFEETDTGQLSTRSNWDNRFLTYQFRMTERGHTLAIPGIWLENIDRRTPTPTFSHIQDPAEFTHTVRREATTSSPGDSALSNTLQLAQPGANFIFERIVSNSPWSVDARRNVALFELPREPLLSMGQLQHLYIHDMPPYAIGNPWGGVQWNRYFDTHFLSGIQEDISFPDFTSETVIAPHPRYSFTAPSRLGVSRISEGLVNSLDEELGVALEVNGQFNFNSTSKDAWKAVLAGSVFTDFEFAETDRDAHDSTTLGASDIISNANDFPPGYTRFPQSIQELFDVDAYAMDSSFDRHMTTMKANIRFLTPQIDLNDPDGGGVGLPRSDKEFDRSDDTLLDECARAVADAVSERLRTEGRPYFSLVEFLTEEFRNGNTLLETVISGDVDRALYPLISNRVLPGEPPPHRELRRQYQPDSGTVVAEDAVSRSPQWFSQADLLTGLAPFISPRSDTFKIRALAETTDASTGASSATAVCEAIVRRTIQPLRPGISLADYAENADSHFGRKFEIISFRWMEDSEL